MATENVTLIDATERADAVQKLGIDLDAYRSTIENANDCTDAIKLIADQSQDGGLVLLLRGIQSYMESVAGDLLDTGRALGIEHEPA